MAGTLYVVASPIGNLGDLSARAAEVLRASAAVVAEDTRRARILLQHIGVAKRPASLPAFAERERVRAVVDRLLAGDDVAFVTDAGTPTVSDPGAHLVAEAARQGIRVVPVPGASAVTAALSASGLPADRFHFLGFLPRKGPARERALALAAELSDTLVFFESPERVAATLLDIARRFGPRLAVMARELTKVHEELIRGTLVELVERVGEVRGEVTLVVAGAPEVDSRDLAESDRDVERALRRRLEAGEISLRDAAREVAEATGRPRREVYQVALRIAGRG